MQLLAWGGKGLSFGANPPRGRGGPAHDKPLRGPGNEFGTQRHPAAIPEYVGDPRAGGLGEEYRRRQRGVIAGSACGGIDIQGRHESPVAPLPRFSTDADGRRSLPSHPDKKGSPQNLRCAAHPTTCRSPRAGGAADESKQRLRLMNSKKAVKSIPKEAQVFGKCRTTEKTPGHPSDL